MMTTATVTNTKKGWAMRKPLVYSMAILFLSFIGAGLARAQNAPYEPPNSQQPYGQPPSGQQPPDGQPDNQQGQMDTDAGVARASFIHGDVSMQRGDNNDVSAVTLNTPLMSGDKISTGGDSRTELQLDFANVLRLDSNAEANLTTLTRSRIQLQISQGLANYTVLKGSDADIEIDTPNIAVRPREGRYRIEVTPDGDTLISVREGDADVATPEGSTQVHKGQLITIHGAANDAQYRVTDAPGNDDWDKWNKDRDGVIYNAQSYQHTNRYYTGAGDLDGYGTWSEVPDYGPVWVPSVDPGWAPYRAGRWVYEPYYGWTWVSEEPWGWAPYHYGRWFVYGGSWAWWPGPVYGGYRPIWAPAYVSFFGFGGGGVGFNFGFGGGFGSIGWLPIGPCDSFHPWWGGYRSRFDVVELRNVNNFRGGIAPLHGGDRFSNLHNVFNNDRLRAGVSGVPSHNFGRGSVAARPVSASDFRNGRMMTGNVPVSPSRESMRASDRPVSASTAARFNNQQRSFSNRSGSSAPSSGRSPAGPVAGPAQGWNRFDSGRASAQSSDRPSNRVDQQSAQQNGRPQGGQANQGAQGPQGQGWQRFSSRPDSSRDSSRGNGGASGNYRSQSSNSYRPPLDMSKPIVDQRSFGNGSNSRSNNAGPNNAGPSNGRPNGDSNNGGNRGGFNAAPSYRPPSVPNPRDERGGYGAPGERSAPSYRGSPSYGGGDRGGDRGGYRGAPNYPSAPSGRSYSAPQSAPSYRGGGNSGGSPSYRAPSGGGGTPSYRGPSGGGGGGQSRGSSGGGGGRSSGGGGGGGGRSSGGSGRSGGHR
jgi:hypothetical protein